MTSQVVTPRSRLNATYRNLTLWTLQAWIAMFFSAAGYAKLTEPLHVLAELMPWSASVSPEMVHGLGMAEIVLAVLVLSPLVSWRLGRPLLKMALVGLLALESVMLVIHAFGAETGPALTNAVLLSITAPVLWLRARDKHAAAARGA